MYCAYPVPGIGSNSLMYYYNGKSVYAPSPNSDDFNRDSPSYPSSKPPSTMFTSTFFGTVTRPVTIVPGQLLPPSRSNSAHFTNNKLGPAPSSVTLLSASGGPISTSRLKEGATKGAQCAARRDGAPSAPPRSTQRTPRPAPHPNPTVSVSPRLCHANGIESIYSPDHTSSSFPSNPSTPVGSPSPLTAQAGAASSGTVVTTSGPAGRAGKSPSPSHCTHHYPSRMEDRLDRLDDAIHVLRNHAVGSTASLPSDIHSLLGQAHNGPIAALGSSFPASGLVSSRTASLGPAHREEAVSLNSNHTGLQSGAASSAELSHQVDTFRGEAPTHLSDSDSVIVPLNVKKKLHTPYIYIYTALDKNRGALQFLNQGSSKKNITLKNPRNLNPKAACLKRREEEKVSGVSGEPQQHPSVHPGLTDTSNPMGHL
uniref:Transcription factor 12 n=1 Tax=Astyanax mexicanus TaxID=7994 RepID=A0A8B9J8S7_ASTMX